MRYVGINYIATELKTPMLSGDSLRGLAATFLLLVTGNNNVLLLSTIVGLLDRANGIVAVLILKVGSALVVDGEDHMKSPSDKCSCSNC